MIMQIAFALFVCFRLCPDNIASDGTVFHKTNPIFTVLPFVLCLLSRLSVSYFVSPFFENAQEGKHRRGVSDVISFLNHPFPPC